MHLAAHRFLQRLARLHKPGEARKAVAGAPAVAPEQRRTRRAPTSMITTGSVRGKVRRPAFRAAPHPAGGRRRGSASRIGRRSDGAHASRSASAPRRGSPPRRPAAAAPACARRTPRLVDRGSESVPLASTAKCGRPLPRPRKIRVAPRSIASRHGASGCQSSAGDAVAAGQRPQIAQRQDARRRGRRAACRSRPCRAAARWPGRADCRQSSRCLPCGDASRRALPRNHW